MLPAGCDDLAPHRIIVHVVNASRFVNNNGLVNPMSMLVLPQGLLGSWTSHVLESPRPVFFFTQQTIAQEYNTHHATTAAIQVVELWGVRTGRPRPSLWALKRPGASYSNRDVQYCVRLPTEVSEVELGQDNDRRTVQHGSRMMPPPHITDTRAAQESSME